MYPQLLKQLPQTLPHKVFEEYYRMSKLVLRRKKLTSNEQAYWDALVLKEQELRAAGIVYEDVAPKDLFFAASVPLRNKPSEFLKGILGEIKAPEYLNEQPKKCNCASRDIFNYGCRCGGV